MMDKADKNTGVMFLRPFWWTILRLTIFTVPVVGWQSTATSWKWSVRIWTPSSIRPMIWTFLCSSIQVENLWSEERHYPHVWSAFGLPVYCFYQRHTHWWSVCRRYAAGQNFVPAILVEGFAEATDFRSGQGIFAQVEKTMEILREHKLPSIFPFATMECLDGTGAPSRSWEV